MYGITVWTRIVRRRTELDAGRSVERLARPVTHDRPLKTDVGLVPSRVPNDCSVVGKSDYRNIGG